MVDTDSEITAVIKARGNRDLISGGEKRECKQEKL